MGFFDDFSSKTLKKSKLKFSDQTKSQVKMAKINKYYFFKFLVIPIFLLKFMYKNQNIYINSIYQ